MVIHRNQGRLCPDCLGESGEHLGAPGSCVGESGAGASAEYLRILGDIWERRGSVWERLGRNWECWRG